MIVTEEDYDSFLDRYPLLGTFLANTLIVRTPLFFGYSLDDPDFRQIWQIIGSRLGKLRRMAYVVEVGATPSSVSRYARRGVKVINLPGRRNQYSRILTALFQELRSAWPDSLMERSTATREESQAALLQPVDSAGRLCFLSAPTKLLSWYKREVYPIIERHGFTPVTADDIVSPGDNPSAIIMGLLDRAKVAIVDATTPNTVFELGLATRREGIQMLAVVGPSTELAFDVSSTRVIVRPDDLGISDSGFHNAIDEWLSQAAQVLRPLLEEEPLRLLQKKEYRAAVTLAVALLESVLRLQVVQKSPDRPSRPQSVGRLLQLAVALELVSQAQLPKLQDWVSIRNRIVHGQATITAKAARVMVHELMEVIGALQSSGV